jgi:hypothetical protein
MTWRTVGVIYAALGVLMLALFLSGRPEVEEPEGGPAAPESLLGTDTSAVNAVVFRRAGREVRAARDGERWRIVEPVGSAIAPDLIAATVATLTAGQKSEIMRDASGGALDAFGLTAPRSVVEVTLAGAPDRPVRILLGAGNPTKTAVYAKREDAPTVYLVGLNVRYYEDLIFEAAGQEPQREGRVAGTTYADG